MKGRRLLGGILDRVEPNPFFVKELRQAVRGKYLINTMFAYLGAAVLVAGGVTWVASQETSPGGEAGGNLTVGIMVILFFVNVLIATYMQNRVAGERTDANVDLFFLTSLSPAAVVRGKFYAGVFLLMELYGIALPFFAFAYLLRGIDILTICMAVAVLFAGGILLMALGLLVGIMPMKKQLRNTLIALVIVMGFQVVPATLMLAASFGGHSPLAGIFTTGRLWPPVLLGSSLWFALLLLCFTLSVAMLSPVHSNRFLPVRVAGTFAGLTIGAISFGIAWTVPGSGVMNLWYALCIWTLILYLGIAVNEPDQWSPRVRRHIPRNPVLRTLAFPFFTGSANALVWILLSAMFCFAFGYILFYLKALFSATGGSVSAGAIRVGRRGIALDQRIFVGEMLCFGYCLGYALVALMVRRWLLARKYGGGRITAWTWTVLLFCVAAGMLLPWAVGAAATFFGVCDLSAFRIGFLPSCFQKQEVYQHAFFLPLFLAVMGLYHSGWFFQRFRRFKPLKSSASLLAGPEDETTGESR